MTLTESLSNVCPQSPPLTCARWARVCLTVGCCWWWLSSVLAAWRPPINWCVECGGGGDQTLAPPPAQGSTGGCDEDTGTTPPPSTQVAEERLWLTPFQAFKFLCLVCGGISVKKGPVTSNMEYFIQALWKKFGMLSWIHKCSDPMTSGLRPSI